MAATPHRTAIRCLVAAVLAAGFGMAAAASPQAAEVEVAEAAAERPYLLDSQGRALPILRGGWTLALPYQFLALRSDARVEATLDELVGIDIDLANAISREAGFAVAIEFRPRASHLEQLRRGEADIAFGVVRPALATGGIRYSKPYRQATAVLVLRSGEASRHRFRDAAGLLAALDGGTLRLAVVEGAAVGERSLDTLLAEPAPRGVRRVGNEFDGYRALVAGEVDALLADHLTAVTTASRGGWSGMVEEHPLRIESEARFAFSERTVPPEVVARFNEAIDRLAASGDLQRFVARHRLPAMLGTVLERRWFLVLDVVGTVAFALSGVLIAVRERYSLLGALVLASLPAVGGGVIRDLLVGREPIGILATPLYLWLVFATVLGGFLAIRAASLLRRIGWGRRIASAAESNPLASHLFEFCDAIGIAAFTVTGVAVAISMRAEPLLMWGPLLAGLTAAGGGILRDLVRQRGEIATLRSAFYGEVPLIWGLLMSVFLLWEGIGLEPAEFDAAVGVTLVGALATRLIVVIRGFRSIGFAAGPPAEG